MYQVEIDVKPKGSLSAKFLASNLTEGEAISFYDQIAAKFGGDSPDSGKARKAKASVVISEADASPASASSENSPADAPAQMSSKRQEKQEAATLNAEVLYWAQKATVIIPDFHQFEQHPYRVAEVVGHTKHLAEMTAKELADVKGAILNTINVYAQAHEDAQAFLQISTIVQDSKTVDELESRKNAWGNDGGLKRLSASERMFNEAKRLIGEKRTLLSTAKVVAEAS